MICCLSENYVSLCYFRPMCSCPFDFLRRHFYFSILHLFLQLNLMNSQERPDINTHGKKKEITKNRSHFSKVFYIPEETLMIIKVYDQRGYLFWLSISRTR